MIMIIVLGKSTKLEKIKKTLLFTNKFVASAGVPKLFFQAETSIVLNLFLNFEQKWAPCFYEIVLIKNCFKNGYICLISVKQWRNY